MSPPERALQFALTSGARPLTNGRRRLRRFDAGAGLHADEARSEMGGRRARSNDTIPESS